VDQPAEGMYEIRWDDEISVISPQLRQCHCAWGDRVGRDPEQTYHRQIVLRVLDHLAGRRRSPT